MTKLNIKNLSYHIGEKIILDNISFSCDSGEVIAIVGKNGVGKTTLLNNILENINKTENIQLNEKANFGYVPQFRQIDEELPLSVEDFVALPLSNKIVPWLSKKEKQRIQEVLELTNSLKQKKKSIGTLSGGERQRVFLSQALVNKPNVDKILYLENDCFKFISIKDYNNEKDNLKLCKHYVGDNSYA